MWGSTDQCDYDWRVGCLKLKEKDPPNWSPVPVPEWWGDRASINHPLPVSEDLNWSHSISPVCCKVPNCLYRNFGPAVPVPSSGTANLVLLQLCVGPTVPHSHIQSDQLFAPCIVSQDWKGDAEGIPEDVSLLPDPGWWVHHSQFYFLASPSFVTSPHELSSSQSLVTARSASWVELPGRNPYCLSEIKPCSSIAMGHQDFMNKPFK